MPREKIFPTILIFIDILAALFYVPDRNIRMVIYWLAAATLTYTVTW
jgi:hypothetical protein